MRPVVRDVAPSVRLLDTSVNCAKTDEQIEMRLVMWTDVGPRNHVLGEGSGYPRKRAVFEWASPCI